MRRCLQTRRVHREERRPFDPKHRSLAAGVDLLAGKGFLELSGANSQFAGDSVVDEEILEGDKALAEVALKLVVDAFVIHRAFQREACPRDGKGGFCVAVAG